MDGQFIASSCLPNPDRQVWEVLIPLNSEEETSQHRNDDVETMIEAGED